MPLNGKMLVCRKSVILLAVMGTVACGCASFKVGEPTSSRRLLDTRSETRIERVERVDMVVSCEGGKVFVAPRARTEESSLEHQEIETSYEQKKVAVGIFPIVPECYDKGTLGDAIGTTLVWPIPGSMMNILLLGTPTISALLFEPFSSEYAGEDALASWSLAGCLKYKHRYAETNLHTRCIQSRISGVVPLPGVLVHINIPELRYVNRQCTDSRGVSVFSVRTENVAQARATVRLADVSASPLAVHLRPFVGKEWSFDLRFEPAPAPQRQATGGRPALPAPTWPLQTVAIADVALAGIAAGEGQALGEWFFNTIAETGYFRLVARTDMQRILEEQKFQSENCTDTECLVEMGRLLAARHMIGGRIARIQDQTVFTARLVDVESGEVIATARETAGTSTREMLGLMSAVAESLCREYGRIRRDGNR